MESISKFLQLLFLLLSCSCICPGTSFTLVSGTLSFEVSRLIADESAGHVEVCVRSTGIIQYFRVHSIDSSARANTDYSSINTIMTIIGLRKCFQVSLVNDNIGEPVEAFKLYLDMITPEEEVIFINRSLTIIITDDDHAEEVSTCTVNGYLLVDAIQEEKEQVVETIRNLLPFDLPDPISSDPKGYSSTQVYEQLAELYEESPQVLYEQLAELYEESPSTVGRDRFTAAVDEIYTAYTNECGKDFNETINIALLAATFNKVTMRLKRIHKDPSDVAQAREIYGKFLCYQDQQESGRRKRQSNDCDCPDPDTVITACQFFNCLEVSDMKFIMGFGDIDNGFSCIAFVVDTTGSMWEEIAAARRVILQFIKSQADITFCYLLVPFNDHDDDLINYDIDSDEPNVGPISSTYTSDLDLVDLDVFVQAVNNLTAYGGGDHAEYAFGAMLAALNYGIGGEILMDSNSEMIVITDATSKEPELRETVTIEAQAREIRIHFILNQYAQSFYEDIAEKTGGTVYDKSHTAWSIVSFYDQLEASGGIPGPGRKKRSASSNTVSLSVSRFVYALRVSILVGISSGTVSITLPDGSVETADIEDSVMIYLKSNPLPGHYLFTVGTPVENVLTRQDVSLDISLLYFDNKLTVSSTIPSPACTTGKLALTTSRSQEISSLTLNETNSTGSSQLIPLTKCSNAFVCDYDFRAGNYTYQVHGVDTDGIDFTYDLSKSAVVRPSPSGTYSLRPINTTTTTVEYSSQFSTKFELRSNEDLGATNFTLTVDAEGFTTSLDQLNVHLLPRQAQIVILTGHVCSNVVPEGSTRALTVTGSNGCETLTATKTVVVGESSAIFRPLNSTTIVMEYTGNFTMEFELLSKKNFTNPVFSLSVSAIGFINQLNKTNVFVRPNQAQVISLWGAVGSSSIGGDTTHTISVTASNGCVQLTASRMITVKPLPTVPPSVLPTNVCGCLNGGTCTVVTRRGRTSKRCSCTPGHTGSRCQF